MNTGSVKRFAKALRSRRQPAGMARRFQGALVLAGLLSPGLLALPVSAADAPVGRVGRAVIAALTPTAVATYPDKTAHDYPKGRLELREGMALSELHTIDTDKSGRLCMVLTPGALVCVRPSSSLRLDRLEQLTEGLPEQGKSLLRRMELTLNRGAILVHGGVPSANTTIRVALPAGTVEANGGEFVVVEDRGAWLVGAYREGVTLVDPAGVRTTLGEGKLLRVQRDPSGKVVATPDGGSVEALWQRFDMCLEFLPDLERFAFNPLGVDMGGLEGWVGAAGGLVEAGDPALWTDVTPSIRRLPPVPAAASQPGASGPAAEGRWTRDRIWAWYRGVGVIRGVNYLPRTAVNTVEFWQADTFNPDAIGEELSWAREAGFNSVRVVLQYAVWAQDPKGFHQRFETFLDLAHRRKLSVVPVLFDDANPAAGDPVPGKQPDPVPGVHNSRWVPSPGQAALRTPAAWEGLERYVRDLVGGFRRDNRILFWHLYNNQDVSAMGAKNLALMESTFRWVRQERATQPVTASVLGDAADPISVRLMELSDLVAFQAFDSAVAFQARLRACEAARRPVICTDWLKRQAGNTFPDILPLLAEKSVGWYSRGLVKGRAQWFVRDDRPAGPDASEVWQQDILWPDGKPYDRKEIELIKAFHFLR